MAIDVERLIKDNYEFLVETRKHFHENPELSGKEHNTAEYIRNRLTEWNIPYETAGDYSTVAVLKGYKEGRTIALRGDIDALPIQEETGVSFASKNPGVMHACGHDCHITFVLGAAKILNQLRSEFAGTIKIIFEEGEEIGTGAKNILATDLLDDVDAIIGLHSSQELDVGKFSLNAGVMTAFGTGETILIETEEGDIHHPENSVNALLVATEIVSAINNRVFATYHSNQQVVLVPTIVQSETKEGQGSHSVRLEYNSRAINLSNHELLRKLFDTVPRKVGESYGARVRVEHRPCGKAVNNDEDKTALARQVIIKHFGENALVISRPSMFGEGFARYQEKIPGVFILVGGAENGNYRVLHTGKTIMHEKSPYYGTALMVHYALDYLNR